MKPNLPISCPAFIALLFVWSVCKCSGTLSPVLLAGGAADSDKTGCYIVVLKDDTTHERLMAIKSQVMSMTEDEELHGSVEAVVKAFTVKLPSQALSIVRSIPEVDYVEEETMVHGAQDDSVIWHVDRLDQYHLPLDNSYQPNGTGEGVDIYILDTGVKYDHEEFEGRAEYGGYDPMDIATGQNLRGDDCNGHGTHVASLAAGKTYGTAKKARIYSIRVLGCSNHGYLSRVMEGLDYVYRIIPERGRPAVVSMSFGSYNSRTTNIALKRLYNENITMVASAGNIRSGSACYITPARSPNVITVAGSAMDDGIYYSTSAGPCVDIFAPASMVQGADYRCASCSKSNSGTSLAAPKVSGIAAIHLEKDPTLSPDQMKEKLILTATPNTLNFTDLHYSYQFSTPNRLLYIGHSVSIDCEEPPGITNGDVSITGLTPGSTATYSCATGYSLLGAQNQTCNFIGKWPYKEPKCVIPCPGVSLRIPNGYLRQHYDYYYNPDLHHLEGSTVYYRCSNGYFLLGDYKRTCQANGTWSDNQPQCVAQCPRLSTITNGYITGHLGNRTEGTIVTYSCIKGYTLVGPVQRICQSNRTWSGHQPSCVLVPPPSEVQALCSVVVWDSPGAHLCSNLIGYDVRLFGSPQLQQNLTKQVRSNRTYYVISDEDNLANSNETYAQVRTVFVDVKGEWSEGISLGCDRPTVVPEKSRPGVYFELSDKIYLNNSAVRLTDIGEAGSALICKTDKEDCCKTIPNRYGEFYYPSGEKVLVESQQQGFYRNRDEQLIRLNKREGTISPSGKYRCEIPDASGETKNVYITLNV